MITRKFATYVCPRHFKDHSSPGIHRWHSKTWFSICSPPAWRTTWLVLPYQSLQCGEGYTYHILIIWIIFRFCITWNCLFILHYVTVQKEQFSKRAIFNIPPKTQALQPQQHILRIYGPQIAFCTFLILHMHRTLLLDLAQYTYYHFLFNS